MNVLVTGGCGYVGSALVPRLQSEGHHVTVLDALTNGSPATLLDADVVDLTLQEGDVRHYGAVERATRDVDAIAHLAAVTGAADSHDNEAETFDVNLDGTRNVVNAAEKHGVDRIVFASSCNVYGRATSERIDESVDPEPVNPYAESKVAGERLLAESTVDTTVLRLSTVYGYPPAPGSTSSSTTSSSAGSRTARSPSTATAATGGRSSTSRTPRTPSSTRS